GPDAGASRHTTAATATSLSTLMGVSSCRYPDVMPNAGSLLPLHLDHLPVLVLRVHLVVGRLGDGDRVRVRLLADFDRDLELVAGHLVGPFERRVLVAELFLRLELAVLGELDERPDWNRPLVGLGDLPGADDQLGVVGLL